jgi:hypothetical protein
VILTGQPPFTAVRQALAGDMSEAFARLDGCGADAELIGLTKACLAPAPEARPADAAEVAERVKRYRDALAERQARAERALWVRQMAERAEQPPREGPVGLPPAAEDARARLRLQAWELLHAEVAAQAQHLSSASPAEVTAARQVLEALRRLPALAGVQSAALASLPEPERQRWEAFWQEVEGLLGGPSPAQ